MRRVWLAAGPLLAVSATAVLFLVLPRGNAFVERWYWSGYPTYVALLGWPAEQCRVSFSSVLVGGLALGLGWTFLRACRRREGAPASSARRILRWAGRWGIAAAWIHLAFVLPWVALHRRAPLEDRLGLPELEDEERFAHLLRRAYDQLHASVGPRPSPLPEDRVEAAVDQALATGLDEHLPAGSRPGRAKTAPRGLLLAFGVSGVFAPGFLEPHVDPALPAWRLPFVLAHEKLHRLGIPSEAEANFLAFQALARSREPALRYAALLALHPYALWAALGRDGLAPLPADVHADWIASVAALRSAEVGALRALQETTNDAYLRLAGDRGGVRSYGVFAVLVARDRLARDPEP